MSLVLVFFASLVYAQESPLKGDFFFEDGKRDRVVDVTREGSTLLLETTGTRPSPIQFSTPEEAASFEIYLLSSKKGGTLIPAPGGQVAVRVDLDWLTRLKRSRLGLRKNTDYSQAEVLKFLAKNEKKNKIRVQTGLTLNSTNKVRNIVRVPFVEASYQLRKLVKLGEKEDAWVYIPESELWIEVGKNESSPGVVNTASGLEEHHHTEISVEDLVDIASEYLGENIVLHIHPRSVLVDAMVVADSEMDTLKEKELRKFSLSQDSLPSTPDFLSLFERKTSKETQSYRHAVCSSQGVTIYYFTVPLPEKGFDQLANLAKLASDVGRTHQVMFAQERFAQDEPFSANDLTYAFCEGVSARPGIEVNFYPFPEDPSTSNQGSKPDIRDIPEVKSQKAKSKTGR